MNARPTALRACRGLVCWTLLVLLVVAVAPQPALAADSLEPVPGVPRQPLEAQVRRIAQAWELATGGPLPAESRKALEAALSMPSGTPAADDRAVAAIQRALDPLCLAIVNINAESRVAAARGPAPAELMQHGWRSFLVKVVNEAGVTAALRCTSPNSVDPRFSSNAPRPEPPKQPVEPRDNWLGIELHTSQPLTANLSGLEVEYRLLSLYSRDAGRREARLLFDVGQGTQDLGFRNELNVLFQCAAAVEVVLDVIDHDGRPTMGQFVIRDAQGRVYPALTRRLAPDMFFHEQIYRASGEKVLLPPGKYTVTYTRGPEYEVLQREITVRDRTDRPHKESIRLKRWIEMARLGWYSGDHHVHAAGCKHYDVPSQGVQPEDMMRHILGEDLNVGCVLSWGPCWYFQKQFFTGQVDRLSTPRHLMRYDVEVSGFPSQHAGHLCLLRLKEDDYEYPREVAFDWNFRGERGHFSGRKTEQIGEWPSWDLPILKWGKQQGGVVGFSHSGWGLKVDADRLPTYQMPPFDGIGANEYIVDVTHGVCDFISAVDTPAVWELNIWYHTLNCGYTCRISGETDFPCIYGERVGLGRSYVKLDANGPLDYDRWVQGIKDGRSYVSDGLSHLFNFQARGLGVGEPGHDGRPSVLALKQGETLNVQVQAAALLDETPRDDLRSRPLDQKPYWHVERARIGDTRRVPVELIVNGEAVARQEIEADGRITDVRFTWPLERSSWVAVRIFPSSHTNPIFVEVDGQPIRASKRSAQWCLDAVDLCWKQKEPQIRQWEKPAAAEAYEHARAAYRQILAAAHDDR